MTRAGLSSLQQSMVLASMRAPRTGVYLIQEVCETPERLDLDLLQRAWQRMAERHTALRTSIEIDSGGKLRQRVNLAEIAWQELDWSRAARDEKPLKLAAWLRNDRDRGFDFGAGVPARVTLIHWAGSCTLIWSMHHALLDARSYLIAWREWFGFYEALSRGDDLRLPQSRPFSPPRLSGCSGRIGGQLSSTGSTILLVWKRPPGTWWIASQPHGGPVTRGPAEGACAYRMS